MLSCRPKPDWNERVTIEIAGRFYRLRRCEERPDGRWWVYAHCLEEAGPHEVLRGFVRYEMPASAGRLLARLKHRRCSRPPSFHATIAMLLFRKGGFTS